MSTPQERFMQAVLRSEGAVVPSAVDPSPELDVVKAFQSSIAEFKLSGRPTVAGFKRTLPDVGVARAFGVGIKEGLLEPLAVFGREKQELLLDETSEKVANFLGTMVGFGIGFVPFAFGTGAVLKGIGMAKHIPKVIAGAGAAGETVQVINPMYIFVRNSIAGSVQFGLGAEEIEDVPGRLAVGAAFGVAIEGAMLGWTMRGRRGFVNVGNKDVPVDLDLLAREAEVAPALGKSARRMEAEIEDLALGDLTYEEILSKLSKTEVEIVLTPNLRSSKEVVSAARTAVPEAQVLSRSTQGGTRHEVLIHNPMDDAARLTEKQKAQWKATGLYDGQPLGYDGRVVLATGIPVEPDFTQVRSLFNPKGAFAVRTSEITKPLTSPAYGVESRARTIILSTAVEDAKSGIGFVIPSATVKAGVALSAKRGIVDVSEFEIATSLKDFRKKFMDFLGETGEKQLAAIDAPSPEEAFAALVRSKGVKGVQIIDEGVTTEVFVFDQGAVSFVPEPPRVALPQPAPIAEVAQAVPEGASILPNVGIHMDQAVVSVTPEGKSVLHSFTPSWKNSIIPAFRKQGLSEKDITALLEDHLTRLNRDLENLLDGDFLAAKKASELQFRDCF